MLVERQSTSIRMPQQSAAGAGHGKTDENIQKPTRLYHSRGVIAFEGKGWLCKRSCVVQNAYGEQRHRTPP